MSKDEFNAFLGTGTIYEGHLNFSGAVRIDGQFKGDIESDGTLILGKDAKVQATVHVGQLIVSGCITGEMKIAKKTIIHKTARLIGTLNTPVLVMEEGAVVQGTVNMLQGDAAIQSVGLVGELSEGKVELIE
ncbi:Polymer-forming protein [Desulfovibrio litoralis DSM 11393]|uniref:Polymer-forming protein n=2 Tax=Desulfovibrio litoralis TaxID=466107 RepID=A0A1M7S864_9BACT|nr:polymer-forming cytoskeletal protein [Desulfovibrio litoralis]SHN54656.1 Polymer-forming protein [Desulfovibrio litoralis DSM 11393]